ncbi:MAG: Re/Si-specific NAD(P)(+) transhydrogenase subunit alpha [Proteobacteria bacterium]|nr:Re/Si-specific NAD(P)(+) transhydrogenase subunit alpha [Pseudomonadota bacterium]MDA1057526.1 Re/Si-specific NAD(P)(+) transhydrogenase subunit alpha [Pseudomonadota bacterium]
MKVLVVKETRAHEKRVAATPDTVKKLVALGCVVAVETGAGASANISDDSYRESGAEVVADIAAVSNADVLLKVQAPDDRDGRNESACLKKGGLLIGMLAPSSEPDRVKAYADRGIVAISLELLPRITRAQSMDVLSSQSNLAGYKAVLDAASVYGRAMPMMMTAAGTVAPAKVFVLGAGVAGLQAIATARRLGAVVSATDVRPVAKEQVESLGAKFVMVESPEAENAETEGGYAREMSAEYQQRQQDLVRATLEKSDIAICTALIPGRRAPTLINAETVRGMKPGAVIVDLAVEQGGNCELSVPGEVADVGGVKIVGYFNVPSRLATDASALYAKNLLNFLTPLIDQESKSLNIDWDDEILQATVLTRDGQVVHPAFSGKAS